MSLGVVSPPSENSWFTSHLPNEVALRAYLPKGELSWNVPEGGLYVWGLLASRYTHDLLREAAARGVRFAPGDSFFSDGAGKRALRLCYSATPPEGIVEGVKRLASALASLNAP